MVYLIHFDEPFKGVQHYLGYSADEKFAARIHHHEKGTGSRLVRAVNAAKIGWSVVRQWPNEDGNFERMLKNKKNTPALCPACLANKEKNKKKRLRAKKIKSMKNPEPQP